MLEKLGQRFTSPSGERRGYASGTDEERSIREGSLNRKAQEKWKVGAKKANIGFKDCTKGCWTSSTFQFLS